jgi:hypothetical protein
MPAEGRGPDLRQVSKVTRPRRLADGPATPLERVQKLQTSLQAKARARSHLRIYQSADLNQSRVAAIAMPAAYEVAVLS